MAETRNLFFNRNVRINITKKKSKNTGVEYVK